MIRVLSISLSIIFALLCKQVLAAKLKIVTEHLAPYQIVTDNSITGLSTEIIEATLKESQYPYELSAHPWSSAFHTVKHEKNTCIYSLARIPSREPLFSWIGHIASSSVSLYSLKNSKITINNIEQAKAYNIAVIRDDFSHHFLLSKGFTENTNLYVVDNYHALLKLLEMPNRNIDLVIINDDLLKYRVANVGDIKKYKNVFKFEELSLDFYLACNLNTDPQIINDLTNAMNTLEKHGTLPTIRSKWKKNMVNLIN